MELLTVDTIEDALKKLCEQADGVLPLETETVPLERAFRRELADNVTSDCFVPQFERSTVDGYAVIASDTFGTGESIPVFLKTVGESEMGKECAFSIRSGECAYVATGAMLPKNANAVVMVEYTEASGGEVAVYGAVPVGKNVVFIGDDVKRGEEVLLRGRRLRSSDLGVLASIGRAEVAVYRPWRAFIISTGDELVPPRETLKMGQIRDVNTFSLIGECERLGISVVGHCIVSDDYELLRAAARKARESADLVIISGGSSKGKKDDAARVIGELCSSGVLTHGLAVKPGKPTITGVDAPSKTAFIGLPGHPVAAVTLFSLLVGGMRTALIGGELKEKCAFGKMTVNIAASAGRKTYQLISLSEESGGYLVTPILGKSALIGTLSRADGYIVLDVNDEGVNKGETVRVHLFD